MKKILILTLIYLASMYGITRVVNSDLFTVESSITGINSTDWGTIQDSCGIKLERHINSTTYHHLADTQTDSTTGTSASVRGAIYWLNDYITNLGVHFPLDSTTTDSVHFSPDTLNVTSVSLTGTQEQMYTNYKSGMSSAIYDYNQHCPKDTSDASDVHIAASVDTLVTKIGTSRLSLPDYAKLSLSATSSGVSTGATMFIDVSQDDITYVHLDSMAISSNTVTYKHITNLYKYMKFYCKYYTDGTYKLQIQTGDK